MPALHATIVNISGYIVRYAVLLLAFFTPLFIIPGTWASASQSKTLLVAVALVIGMTAWLVRSVVERRLLFSFDPVLLAALLIPFTYLASALFSGTASSYVSGDALAGSVASMMMLFAVASLAAMATHYRRRTAISIILSILISAALLVVFQFVRILFPGFADLYGSLQGVTSSVVGSWHDLGIFVGLVLLLSCGLLETSFAQEQWKSIFLKMLAGVSYVMLMLVAFADTWFVIAGAALVFASLRFKRLYWKNANIFLGLRYAALWILLAISALLFGFFGSYLTSRLPAQLQLTQVEVRPSWQGTFTVSQRVLGEGKTFVFGTGPNSFDQEWARFKPKEVNATNFWNVDFQYGIGVVPTAFVTVGLLGTSAWVLLIVALLWLGYRLYREEPDPLRGLLFAASGFLLAFHVFYVPGTGISVLLFLSLGMLAGARTTYWRAGELSFAPKSMLAFAVVLAVVCGAFAAVLLETRTVYSTLLVYRAGAQYSQNKDIGKASSEILRAVRIDPNNDIAQRAAIEVGLVQFQALVKSSAADTASRDELQKSLSSTIAHGLAAVSIDGANYQNWLALASLYQSLAGIGIPGAYEQAHNAYLKAASTTPQNPLPYLQLGQLSMMQGKNDEARGYLTQAIELKSNLPLPYYLRSQLHAARGDTNAAIQDAVTAAQIANQDPLSWYNLGVLLYTGNDFANAAAAFEKSVSLQNQYADALFGLGIVYDKLGEHDRAISAIQSVLNLNPNNPIAAKVMQNLQEGKPALLDVQSQQVTGAADQQNK